MRYIILHCYYNQLWMGSTIIMCLLIAIEDSSFIALVEEGISERESRFRKALRSA